MRSKTTAKRPAAKRPAKAKTALGALPEWNLADLYSGLDDPAIKRDLDRADVECVAFENAFKGKLGIWRVRRMPQRRSSTRYDVMKRSTILWGGSPLMLGSSTPATLSIRRGPNSTAMCRSG
jgi:hypothetical protein